MPDFVESAKHFVSSAVSRTSWEAQKQMRVRNKQSEIDKLLDQRHQLLNELGQRAMTLYQQGGLSDPELSRVCAGIMDVDNDIRTREAQLQDVKKETYTADQSVAGSAADYAAPPFTPPSAGTPTSDQAARPSAQTQVCPTCGSVVRANALYCRSCGTKLRQT
jgi:hypothetical protein